MRNRCYQFFLFFLCVTCAQTHADGSPFPDEIILDGDYLDETLCPVSLGVTFLYLRPNIDDTAYVLSSINNVFNGSQFPNGKRHQNKSDFAPGFSVEALYTLCPDMSFLAANFTYLSEHARDTVSGPFLYDTNGFPGFGAQDSPIYAGVAHSKNCYSYYSGDLTYRRRFSLFCLERFTWSVGLHGAYIRFREHTTSSGTFENDDGPQILQNDFKRNSAFFGVGPEIGFKYDYYWPDLCTLYAKGSAALLCGPTKSNLQYVTRRTGPVGVSVQNDRVWRVIPAAHAELGLSYGLCCGCWNVLGELGYTLIWYGHCVNKVTGLETAFAGDTIDMFQTFSLHGPCLRFSVAF
jgi:hypothetical protein